MKQTLLLLLSLLISLTTSAQEKGTTGTGSANPPIPQIPLEECDSLKARDVTDRYGVVYKDGKCGIYDLVRQENVTRIEYSYLWYAYRKKFEGEYYTYFSWEEPETIGVIGVAEANNEYVCLSSKKILDGTE